MQSIIDKTIAQLQERFGLVGGILVAVKDGKTILKQAFGHADRDSGRYVDTKTVFQIASCSKAFTTMMAAQLCEEGKLDWDKPVQTWMPEFRLMDPYATEHVTPRDLACHRTGLSRHDAMRTYVREDRADLVRRMAYFPPTVSFRERYYYQNQNYVALGYLCERVSGRTWEQWLTERIGKPLGMELYYRGHVDIHAINAAMPYLRKNGETIRVDEVVGQASNPCGGVYTNADSLERWIKMLAAGGALDSMQIISKQGLDELLRPNIPVPGKPRHPKELQVSYGLAWNTSAYKGQRVAYQGGWTNGFNSQVGFFPERNMAYALSVNTEDTPSHEILAYLLRDLLLGEPEIDYSWLMDLAAPGFDKGTAFTEEELADLPLTKSEAAAFCGIYENPGYGEMEFIYENDALHLSYGLVELDFRRIADRRFLAHGYPGTFRAHFREDGDLSIRFSVDAVRPIEFIKR